MITEGCLDRAAWRVVLNRSRCASATLRLALLLASAPACGDDRANGAGREDEQATASSKVVTDLAPSAPRRAAPHPTGLLAVPLRVAASSPPEGAPLATGEVLTPARAVDAGGHALTLDFEHGGRIEVEPHARFARSAASLTGIILGEGGLHAILPPEGGSVRSPLRIITPAGTFEIAGSGELFVRVLPDGAAWVAQFAGLADVFSGDMDDDGRLVARRLVAGRSLVLGQGLGDPVGGPRTVDAARAVSSRLAQGVHRPTAAELAARQEAARSALTARIRGFDEELQRGRELQRRHRELVASQDPLAMELQARIVLHSQAMLRARQAILIAWEKASATSLHAGDDGAWLEPLREGAGRAVSLLRGL